MHVIYLIIFLVLLWVFYGKNSINNFAQVNIGGEKYKAHKEFDNYIDAAKKMDEVNDRVIKLLKCLMKDGQDTRPEVKRLLERYDWGRMRENSPNNVLGTTSYMEDKGKIFALCLRSKDGKFVDINTLTFVTIHELAHLMTTTYGHDAIFWARFKYLLEYAVRCGVYRSVDYSFHPVQYCGMTIESNPLY
jgi:hypothetical protein